MKIQTPEIVTDRRVLFSGVSRLRLPMMLAMAKSTTKFYVWHEIENAVLATYVIYCDKGREASGDVAGPGSFET